MRINKIKIEGWCGNHEESLNWELDPEVNIIRGGINSHKEDLLWDIYSLICPEKILSPEFKGKTHSSHFRIEFPYANTYIDWKGRSNAIGFDLERQKALTQYYNPVEYMEGFGIDNIYSNMVEEVLLKANSTDRYYYMKGINCALGLEDGPAQILVGNSDTMEHYMYLGDRSEVNLGEVSLGMKFLMSLILSVPMGQGSIFIVGFPEMGLPGDVCAKLVTALRRVNKDMQLIIHTSHPYIGNATRIESLISTTEEKIKERGN